MGMGNFEASSPYFKTSSLLIVHRVTASRNSADLFGNISHLLQELQTSQLLGDVGQLLKARVYVVDGHKTVPNWSFQQE